MQILVIGLTVVACLSPLLTLAHLWQMKEWRLDRLKEHLQREGVWKLWGILRPLFLVLFAVEYSFHVMDAWYSLVSIAGVLALLSIAQILLRKQPMPVWTMKAITVVLLTFVLDVVLINLAMPLARPFVVILQPFVVFVAWLFLKPLDFYLKNQIIQKAITMRNARKDITVIGITGSVGKTTTKELLLHLLKDKGAVATPTYVNAEIGVARWLTKVLPDTKNTILIVEMGAYRKGEIKLLTKIAQPQMGIVTFIGTQHIALFGSQQNLCDAKGELIEALPKDGKAFLNADSELCASLKAKAKSPVVMVGTGGRAELEAFDIEETSSGIRFRMNSTQVNVPLHGTHNVTNVLLATAAAESLGMSEQEIATKLKSFQPLPETFAVRTVRDVTILDDTHNSSETSFRAAIEWARSQTVSPKTLITFGLIELGNEQEHIHTELGALAASVFDRVIFTSKNGQVPFAKGFGKPVEHLSSETTPVAKNSLLVCVGRMSKNTIERLIP